MVRELWVFPYLIPMQSDYTISPKQDSTAMEAPVVAGDRPESAFAEIRRLHLDPSPQSREDAWLTHRTVTR